MIILNSTSLHRHIRHISTDCSCLSKVQGHRCTLRAAWLTDPGLGVLWWWHQPTESSKRFNVARVFCDFFTILRMCLPTVGRIPPVIIHRFNDDQKFRQQFMSCRQDACESTWPRAWNASGVHHHELPGINHLFLQAEGSSWDWPNNQMVHYLMIYFKGRK